MMKLHFGKLNNKNNCSNKSISDQMSKKALELFVISKRDYFSLGKSLDSELLYSWLSWSCFDD